jgi:hypothetical protein
VFVGLYFAVDRDGGGEARSVASNFAVADVTARFCADNSCAAPMAAMDRRLQ